MRKQAQQFKDQFGRQKDRLDALSFYGRCGVLVAGILILLVLWQLFLMGPIRRQQSNLKESISIAKEQSSVLGAKLRLMQDELAGRNISGDQLSLESKLHKMEQNINIFSGEFIPADKMDDLLKDMLAKEKSLKLLRIRSLPEKRIAAGNGKTLSGSSREIIEQGMSMTFEGDYFSTLRFLKHVEALKWQVFWNQLDYAVTQYPNAQVTLTIHTLSEKVGKS